MWVYHLTLFAQYAADILPLAMLVACRAWKDLRRAAYDADSPDFLGDPVTPFCPNLISLVVVPVLARTACDLVGWLGVALGLLYPLKVSDPRLMVAIISYSLYACEFGRISISKIQPTGMWLMSLTVSGLGSSDSKRVPTIVM